MVTYVYDKARRRLVEKRAPRASRRLQIVADIEPYDSPVDGAYVGGRAAQREDLKRHHCRLYEEGEKEVFARARADADRALARGLGEMLALSLREG